MLKLKKWKDGHENNIEKVHPLEAQRKAISTATTLESLGLSLEEAVQILDANNMPLILCEEDKAVTERKGEFQGLEDFILVHETRFPPTQGKIKSPKEAQAIESGYSISLEGKEYTYEIPYMRDTVHFALNTEVNTDHGLLNCDDCKYAVLIPFVDIPKERLKGEASDMYTVNGGPVLTSNSYILCPKGEAEALRKNNPGVKVVEYEGESVRGYARAFLSTLGYRQSDTGKHSFVDEKDSLRFLKIMQENGIELSTHFYSKEARTEHSFGEFEKEIAVYKIIKENGLIQNEEDMARITEQLKSQYMLKRFEEEVMRKCPISSEEQKQYFLRRMKEENIDLTSIIEGKEEWRKGDVLQTAIDSLLREKLQENENIVSEPQPPPTVPDFVPPPPPPPTAPGFVPPPPPPPTVPDFVPPPPPAPDKLSKINRLDLKEGIAGITTSQVQQVRKMLERDTKEKEEERNIRDD